MSSSRQRIGDPACLPRKSSLSLFSSGLWNAVGLQPKSLSVSRGLFFPEGPRYCSSAPASRDLVQRQGVATCRENKDVKIQEFHHHKRRRASSEQVVEFQFLYADLCEPNYEALSSYPRRNRTGKRRGTSNLKAIAEDLGLGLSPGAPTRLFQTVTGTETLIFTEKKERPNPHELPETRTAQLQEPVCSPRIFCDEDCGVPSTSMEVDAALPSKLCSLLHKEHSEHVGSDWGGAPGTSSGNSSQGAFAVEESASPLPSPLRDARSSESVKLPPSWSPDSDPMSSLAGRAPICFNPIFCTSNFAARVNAISKGRSVDEE
ncbi:hypothetical protein CEUSTIGMA_g4798.t1 [Chlamydomonas eustigma]|uniref:Uncharacterized protein n=1 Tax=Chlamydomonas eustigma TaxID=1157962 RepID=A0A250X373_9CHLO|nr:hypothetical protein CEUSTIGMA_g4798.t1 [Chlamydomonas eustigma]|eukprot:GAX77352.1 hypothetical protein CEUSTIGMA_g4798.t1 [Chlamydomonas eustigma]